MILIVCYTIFPIEPYNSYPKGTTTRTQGEVGDEKMIIKVGNRLYSHVDPTFHVVFVKHFKDVFFSIWFLPEH